MASPNWVDYLLKAAVVIDGIVKAGQDAEPFVSTVVDSIRSGVTPTEADWNELRVAEKGLRAELHAPLPPESL